MFSVNAKVDEFKARYTWFHLHTKGSCLPKLKGNNVVAGFASGGHYDPSGTNKPGSPWGDGHVGDLPALYVDTNEEANQPVLARA